MRKYITIFSLGVGTLRCILCNRIAGEGRVLTSYGVVCYDCITMIEDIANEVHDDEMPEMQQALDISRVSNPHLGKIHLHGYKQ